MPADTPTVYEIDERRIGSSTVVVFLADTREVNDKRAESGDASFRHSQEPQFRVRVENDGREVWAGIFYSFRRAWDAYEHPFAVIPDLAAELLV